MRKVTSSKYFAPLVLFVIIFLLYYKFFILGQIPFPGGLLVTAYSPWFDYYKNIPIQNSGTSDVFSQFFIWKYLSIDSIKNFELPLWNPYAFSGTPFLATYHSAVLYPLNLILLLPKYFGWGVFIFSQTLIAALTMYLLLSCWIKSKTARIVGALIFSLGGMMTTWLEFGTAVHAISWLPLTIYATTKYSNSIKFKFIILLSISLSFIILAGNVQIAIYSFTITLLFALLILWTPNLRRFIKLIFPVLLGLFLPILFTAPQLLPTYELYQKSIRTVDTFAEGFNHGLLPFQAIFKLFIPDYFGNPVTGNYWGFLDYHESAGFIGTLTLILLIYLLFFVKKTKIIFFSLSLFLVSLILSFQNPISEILYGLKIPLLTFSFASRMLFITVFSTSILAAFSLNDFLSQREVGKLLKSSIWSIAAILGVILGLLLSIQWINHIVNNTASEALKNSFINDPLYSIKNFQVALRNSIIPLIVTSFMIIVLFLYQFKKTNQRFGIYPVAVILLFLMCLDLGRYFLKFTPFVPSNQVLPTTPALEYLQNKPGVFRMLRENAEILPPNTWVQYRFQSIEGYDPLYLKHYGKFIRFLNSGDIKREESGRFAALERSAYNSPYLDMANVKYLMVVGRGEGGIVPGELIHWIFNEGDYRAIYRDKSAVILENPNALPRAYLAKSVQEASLNQMEDTFMFDKSFDPRITTLLSSDFGVKDLTGEGEITIQNYSDNEVKIATKTSRDEILVLTDQYDDGWKAKINGQQVEIERANLVFRAIKIPPGENEVIFYYWPKSLTLGLKISLFSFLSLPLFWFFFRKYYSNISKPN